MILADLIKGKKTAITLPPATAILAIPAILNPNQAEKQAKNSRIAEIAIAESEQTDNKPGLFCADGGCHCSQKLPAADYPNGCGACEYLNNPRQAKEPTETIPATFEQTGDPVTCPYWYQVCHAVSFYQDACTRCTDCQIFKFLKVNT